MNTIKIQKSAKAVDSYFEQFAGKVFTNVDSKSVNVEFYGRKKMNANAYFDFQTQKVTVVIYSAGERIKKKTVRDLAAAEAIMREFNVIRRRRRNLNS